MKWILKTLKNIEARPALWRHPRSLFMMQITSSLCHLACLKHVQSDFFRQAMTATKATITKETKLEKKKLV
jgi:hypothetical protein